MLTETLHYRYHTTSIITRGLHSGLGPTHHDRLRLYLGEDAAGSEGNTARAAAALGLARIAEPHMRAADLVAMLAHLETQTEAGHLVATYNGLGLF